MTLRPDLTRNIFCICLAAVLCVAVSSMLSGCHHESIHSDPAINHLKGQASSYLLDHANDPVHWYPWGDEAFAVARRDNKPIFLSSGFAACHWCHVMHHESFEDAAIAKILNDNFVSILVDREERPYVDEVYSRAALAIGGKSGSPLTVFLTPDKKPFFAGTYFPRKDKMGLPSFAKILQGVLDSWHKHRSDVDKTANQLCLSVYTFDGGKAGPAPDQSTIDQAGAKLLNEVDYDFGGILGVRKLALPGALTLAMQKIVLDPKQLNKETAGYSAFLSSTLNHMALGGVRDQLNGGFFRLSTDREWRVPHFEKMLDNNALMAQIYLEAGLLNKNDHWKAIGLDTLDYCLKDLSSPDGTFFSSVDADSGGEEGAYYKFTPEEITRELGAADGKLFCTIYSVNSEGGGEAGGKALYFSMPEEKLAQTEGVNLPQFEKKIAALKAKLAASPMMQKRVRPVVDKKIITSWNALMISALVQGYKVSGDERYLGAAKKCASFLLKNLCQGKLLHRIWAEGKADVSGCLDDYSFFVRALLDLATIDSDPAWLNQAIALNQTIVGHFFSHRVGFYLTANNKEQALVRTGCARDNGGASPAAIEIMNLVRLYEITGDSHLKTVIERTVKRYGDGLKAEPISYGFLLAAMDRVFHQGQRLEILEGDDKDVAKHLKRQLYQYYAPHMVSVVLAPPQFAALANPGHPGRTAQSATANKSAAYFCNSLTKVCDRPLTDPLSLKSKLSELAFQGGL